MTATSTPAAISTATNGVIQASQLKPRKVGDDRTFSPYCAGNGPEPGPCLAARELFGDLPASWDRRTGTCRWLQEWTVRPQPHWQVSDSSISCCVGRCATPHADSSTASSASAAAPRGRSLRRGLRRRVGAGSRAALRGVGHIATTVPSARTRPPSQSQTTSGFT